MRCETCDLQRSGIAYVSVKRDFDNNGWHDCGSVLAIVARLWLGGDIEVFVGFLGMNKFFHGAQNRVAELFAKGVSFREKCFRSAGRDIFGRIGVQVNNRICT